MKKSLLFGLLFVVVVNLLFIFGLSIPLWRIGDAIQVSTGLGAKLACSGRYISGFSQEQMVEDLSGYSPATRINNLVYDDEKKRVTADFWGMAEVSAQFRPGIGCTLEFGDSSQLNDTVVKHNPSNNAQWPLGSSVSHLNADVQNLVEQILINDNQSGLDTRALVVVHDGKIIAEAYKPGVDQDTPLLGWSMGKSLTAILLGNLELNDVVDVGEGSLFNEWMQDERAQISVENLLQMSSGLEFDEIYIPGSDSTKMLFTQHSASDYALKSELKELPGSHFYYSSGTTNLLSRLIFEKVGGTSQQAYDFLYQDFFAPLRMNNSWFEPDASGVFIGSSYPYLSGRDWARLALLMLNRGELNSTRLLSEDWVNRAISPNPSTNDSRYGYQFWLNRGGETARWPSLPEDMYAMHGNRHQLVAMFPSQALAVVRLGWSGSYPEDEMLATILAKVENLKE